MKKTYLATILTIVFLILLGASYWQYKQTKPKEKEIVPSVSINPLDNKPNINPVDQTNPFTNVKTNPFE